MQKLHGDGEEIQGPRVLRRRATNCPRRAMQRHIHNRGEVHTRDGARSQEV